MLIGDAKTYKIQGVGEIAYKIKIGKIKKMLEVFYVSRLQSNLLSVGQLMKKDFDIHSVNNLCIMKNKNQLIARINLGSNNLFHVKLDVQYAAKEEIFKLWHDRFGDLNFQNL